MPGSELIAEIQRGRAPARPAEDQFTAMVPADGFQTFSFCRRVLLAFEEAGVPPDATIQWSHPTIYATWRREVPEQYLASHQGEAK